MEGATQNTVAEALEALCTGDDNDTSKQRVDAFESWRALVAFEESKPSVEVVQYYLNKATDAAADEAIEYSTLEQRREVYGWKARANKVAAFEVYCEEAIMRSRIRRAAYQRFEYDAMDFAVHLFPHHP